MFRVLTPELSCGSVSVSLSHSQLSLIINITRILTAKGIAGPLHLVAGQCCHTRHHWKILILANIKCFFALKEPLNPLAGHDDYKETLLTNTCIQVGSQNFLTSKL